MTNHAHITETPRPATRVRAILFTGTGSLLLIKRVRPGRDPYWVAPGGRIDPGDRDPQAALVRELYEELGATIEIARPAFRLAEGDSQQLFYVCRLLTLNLAQRHGPELSDPARGAYIPTEIPLTRTAILRTNIQPPALHNYLLVMCG